MTVRVVIADDSDLVVETVTEALQEDASIRVIGRAIDGQHLLSLPVRPAAQVILLDLLMPQLGGLSVIKNLCVEHRVIILSSVAEKSELAQEALAQGASAFFSKRSLARPEGVQALRTAVRQSSHPPKPIPMPPRIIAVAGSTGAISVLHDIARSVAGSSATMLVVQHLPAGRERDLARDLTHNGIRARPAQPNDGLEPGVLIAPSGKQMRVRRTGTIALTDDPPTNGHCPSADVLYESLLPFGDRVIAVVLSGLGKDGAAGISQLAKSYVPCVVQCPSDCVAPSMPEAALSSSRRVQALRPQQLCGWLKEKVRA